MDKQCSFPSKFLNAPAAIDKKEDQMKFISTQRSKIGVLAIRKNWGEREGCVFKMQNSLDGSFTSNEEKRSS